MALPRRQTALRSIATVLGLLLVTNSLWLVPHEGDVRYTYERAEIHVENGTLTYHGIADDEFAAENDLEAVGCQKYDDDERACAFDRHLIDHDPVTEPRVGHVEQRVGYVELDSRYYERVVTARGTMDNGTRTFTVEQVQPETVLDAVAVDASTVDADAVDADVRLPFRLAVTGGTATSYERLDEDELGTIFHRDGSYYTVVGTDETFVDRGLSWLASGESRALLAILGVFVLLGVALRLAARIRRRV
jgi:hypothetical protein